MHVRILTVIAAAGFLAQSAWADLPEAKTVHFSTCTEAGVEHGCVVARGDDGALYNVTSTGVGPGAWLQGTAAVTNRVSFCMQGSTIDRFVPDSEQKQVTCRRD